MKLDIVILFLIMINLIMICPDKGTAQNQANPLVKLPFGSPVLITHKFPKYWNVSFEDDTNKKHVSIHTKALNKIDDYYLKLGRNKSIKGPIVQKYNYLGLGDDSHLIPYEKKFQADFKCRLPDFGSYECYYQYLKIPMPYYYELEVKSDGSNKLYLEYGNMVFYDPKTKKARILNIYNSYEYKEPTEGFSRYFYIDKNKTIQIFEAIEGESSASIRKSQEVKINSDGKFIIKKIKQI